MSNWKKWFGKVGIKGVEADSRKVRKGDVFVAYKGVEVDGHDYINKAIKNGAVAVVGEKSLKLAVPYKKVANGRLAWAQMTAEFYNHPEKGMELVGVTGTDGKTTTVNIIFEVLKKAGVKAGMSSTVGAKIGNRKVMSSGDLQTGSPSPDVLFSLLHQMNKEDIGTAVLEVTSHGLDQDRLGDIVFEIGVITNLGSDHMEYHGNLKKYRRAKAKIIDKSKSAKTVSVSK